jgi:hypothetical protein
VPLNFHQPSLRNGRAQTSQTSHPRDFDEMNSVIFSFPEFIFSINLFFYSIFLVFQNVSVLPAPTLIPDDDSIVSVYAREFLASNLIHITQQRHIQEAKRRKQNEQLSIHTSVVAVIPPDKEQASLYHQDLTLNANGSSKTNATTASAAPDSNSITSEQPLLTSKIAYPVAEPESVAHPAPEPESKQERPISQQSINASIEPNSVDISGNPSASSIAPSTSPVTDFTGDRNSAPSISTASPFMSTAPSSMSAAPPSSTLNGQADPSVRLSPVALALKLNAELSNLEAVEATRVKVFYL